MSHCEEVFYMTKLLFCLNGNFTPFIIRQYFGSGAYWVPTRTRACSRWRFSFVLFISSLPVRHDKDHLHCCKWSLLRFSSIFFFYKWSVFLDANKVSSSLNHQSLQLRANIVSQRLDRTADNIDRNVAETHAHGIAAFSVSLYKKSFSGNKGHAAMSD